MKTFLLTIALFFSFSLVASAAVVSVDAPNNTIKGQKFSVFVHLDTGGVLINSFDIKLSYPRDVISFSGYKEDGSIKRIWLTPPTDKGGEIHFSGIIPGGVDGLYDPDKDGLQPLPLIQLLFSAKNEGTGTFDVTHSEILKNDGKGTPLIHTDKNAIVSISKGSETTLESKDEIQTLDTEAPEPFVMQFVPSSLFSKTPSMVVFFTTDKDTGIEKYQLHTSGDKWKDVSSPLQVNKSILKRNVIIRAVDFAGNIRQSQIDIPGLVSSRQLLGIIILGIICYFIYFVLKRKR